MVKATSAEFTQFQPAWTLVPPVIAAPQTTITDVVFFGQFPSLCYIETIQLGAIFKGVLLLATGAN